MGRGQTTQERRKEKSCQKAAGKPQWENTDHTNTHTHTLPPAMEPGSAAPSCSAAPHKWPQDSSVPKSYISCLPFLLLTPTALDFPIIVLVVRVSLPPVWRTGNDCHHPNLGTQVLQGKGMARQHRLCPAGGSGANISYLVEKDHHLQPPSP